MKEKIALYKSVVLKTVDYGGEFWYSALEIKKYRESLNRVQRRVLISMTGAFKTTSYEKLFLATNLISFDLEIWRRKLYSEKMKELKRPLNEEERREYEEVLQEENRKNFAKGLNEDLSGANSKDLENRISDRGLGRAKRKGLIKLAKRPSNNLD